MRYKEYELDLLEVESAHKRNTSPYRFWYNDIKKKALENDGDILEFGVYRGRSLITAALILKQLKSKKTIYGFDTFAGLPLKTNFDDFKNFQNKKYFSKKISDEHKKYIKLKKYITGINNLNTYNISVSGKFRNSSYDFVKKKIKYFNLDNIKLIKGDFTKTLPIFFKSNDINISSVNIDSDLYDGYRVILQNVYKRLSKNGYIFLDEYYSLKFPGPKIAVDNFCKKSKIKILKHKVRKEEFQRYYLKK